MAKSKMKRKRAPKSVLKLPDLEQSKSAVLNSLTSPSSQRTYDHAIREFIEWYCSEPRLAFNKTVVTRYRISLEQQHYASTTINLRLAAVRRLAYEAADCGLLSADLAAGIRRVKGAKRLGMPVGNWLSAEQGKRLLRTVDIGSLRGKRDYATLAILLGCGLRRAELTALRVEDIQQREEHWVIADLIGKGGHIRTIPVPDWVKAGIDAWMAASGITGGILLRSINKAGRVWGCGFSPKVIWGVVKEKAKICEIPALAPHDLLPASGGILIALGDVSGKGLRAAMTVSSILGALRAISITHPAEILTTLNRTLVGRLQGGFVTCLCGLIVPDGSLTLANAGHLAPYRNGQELQLDSSLPSE